MHTSKATPPTSIYYDLRMRELLPSDRLGDMLLTARILFHNDYTHHFTMPVVIVVVVVLDGVVSLFLMLLE